LAAHARPPAPSLVELLVDPQHGYHPQANIARVGGTYSIEAGELHQSS